MATRRTINIDLDEYIMLKRKAELLDELMKDLPKIREFLKTKLMR